MIESVLVRKNVKTGVKITVKTLISAGLVVLAVLLPQLVHFTLGSSGGVVAAHVSARSDRRLHFGYSLGLGDRHSFAPGELFADFRFR